MFSHLCTCHCTTIHLRWDHCRLQQDSKFKTPLKNSQTLLHFVQTTAWGRRWEWMTQALWSLLHQPQFSAFHSSLFIYIMMSYSCGFQLCSQCLSHLKQGAIGQLSEVFDRFYGKWIIVANLNQVWRYIERTKCCYELKSPNGTYFRNNSICLFGTRQNSDFE